jgi:hypothetical protein
VREGSHGRNWHLKGFSCVGRRLRDYLRPELLRGTTRIRPLCRCGFKRKHPPGSIVNLDPHRITRLPCETGNGPIPKPQGCNVRVHHADLPPPGKPPPHLVRDFDSNSVPAPCAKDKKLRHVPDYRVARNRGAARYKNKSTQFPVDPYQKWMAALVAPVKRELSINKAPVRP